MADWEHRPPAGSGPDAREGREWRAGPSRAAPTQPIGGRAPLAGRLDEPRGFGADLGERDIRRARSEGPAGYSRNETPFQPGGGAAQGYGEGGDTSYGQMASGSSDSALGGYSGSDVGGWGQPVQNSQWGQGGYGPLNQGLDYGQDGGRFGPQGYDTGRFGQASPTPRGPAHHDEHHVSYHHWRNTQLSTHDRDYARWREEQARRYDEDYGSWRNERHAAFSREFEGWRAGRGGPAGATTPSGGSTGSERAGSSATVNPSERVYSQSASPAEQGAAHGANPTLAKIADGHEGRQAHDHDHSEPRDDASKS